MILILIIVSSLILICLVVLIFVLGFKKPNRLQKLNAKIFQASTFYNELSLKVDKILDHYNFIEKAYNEIKLIVNELNTESNTLKNSIDSQKKEIHDLNINKLKFEKNVQELEIKLNEISDGINYSNKKRADLSREISELRNEKFNLKLEFDRLEIQIAPLKIENQALLERKFDLEQENSHLSKEIIKKKTSYRNSNVGIIEVVKYEDIQEPVKPIKYIGFIPHTDFSSSSYPCVLMPHLNAAIQFPRKGRLGQRGFTEPAFEEALKTYFFRQRNLQLYIDRILFISNGTNPYEPDFTIIDETNDFNLFLNIEVDEPYDGIERNAIHFIGNDNYRNKFFHDRGWVVIRFSELQIHLNPKGCCCFIARVIKSLNNNFSIPYDLQQANPLIEEPFWTKVHAEKWAKINYRENYLGIDNFEPPKVKIIKISNLNSNENEKEVAKQIPKENEKPECITGSLNKINEHQRDRRIKFFSVPHIYIIDDNPNTISVSTLVKSFFQDFDGEYWANRNAVRDGLTPKQLLDNWEINRQEAANKGTELHLNIEQFFESGAGPEDKVEFNHFLKLYNTELKKLKAYRTEWRIFDDILYIAGTVDMVFKKLDGTYAIYDWKRSKDIKRSNSYHNGFGPCSTLEDCNYNHYCLQINIYKKILEDHYAKSISEMKMVQLHPNFDDYQIFEIPDMQDEVNSIYEAIM